MRLADLLFPTRCALCGSPVGKAVEDGLCPDCRTLIQRDRARCLRRSLLYLDVICATEYSGAVRGALLRVKERGKNAAVGAMARMAVAAYEAQKDGFTPDVVTFVPSSALREHTRGFTLPEEMAKYTAGRLGVPCRPLLGHTLLSARQAGMHKQQRRAHAEHSLSVRQTAAAEIEGKRILLVDDIIASGATMNQAARLLREAGASEVVGLALAKSTKDR